MRTRKYAETYREILFCSSWRGMIRILMTSQKPVMFFFIMKLEMRFRRVSIRHLKGEADFEKIFRD